MFGKKKEKAQSDKSRMDDFLDAAAEVSAEPDTGTNAGAGRMGAERDSAEEPAAVAGADSGTGAGTAAGSETGAQPGENILKMRGITKDYIMGDEVSHVLKGIDLDVARGEFLAVLGPSGSGKSTLMNIIGCLDTPTSGDYWLSGVHIADQNERQLARIRNRQVGFVFQSFQLLQKQTARENVELPLIYANIPEKKRRERVEEVIEKVGLKDRIDYYPNQLSGGQQQRIAIARAIAVNPTILLADEPTGALDQQTGKQVMELFHELNREGRTIIMITHDRHIASHARRIVRILDGNLIEGGEAEDA